MLNKNQKHPPIEATNLESDLVEIVLEPLSALIDRTRLEVLDQLKDVASDVEIIMRQIRREMDSETKE